MATVAGGKCCGVGGFTSKAVETAVEDGLMFEAGKAVEEGLALPGLRG